MMSSSIARQRYSNLFNGLSPSTRPGFIQLNEIEKISASIKQMSLNSSIETPSLFKEWSKGPSKIEMATIQLFPKVIKFLRNQDHPLLPRSIALPSVEQANKTDSDIENTEPPILMPDSSISSFAAPQILFANVKKKRKAKMNKHKRKKRRRALRYKAPSKK